jgi:quercetin dioxygenase-like cupin family protein
MDRTNARDAELRRNQHGAKASLRYMTDHAQAIHMTLGPGESLRRHVALVYVCFYVLEGTGVVESAEEKKEIGPDTLINCPTMTPHCWYNAADRSRDKGISCQLA